MSAYREWLAFHIEAQRGMFIDEVVPAPGRAGVMIFSASEAEPMWNLLFVDVPTEACRCEAEIAQAFAARGRQPVWYVPDPEGAALPPSWQATGQNTWMARGTDGVCGVLTEGLALRRVMTPRQAECFNQLYLDVFWGAAPSSDAALPIPETAAWTGVAEGTFEVRHWLLIRGDRPVVLLTTLRRGERAGLYNVGTDPAMTRRGFASQAIRAVIDELQRQGVQEVFLLTECDPALAPFYARLGFGTVATGQFYRRQEAK
jgi:GNAT superfamily N-acetyltransferase